MKASLRSRREKLSKEETMDGRGRQRKGMLMHTDGLIGRGTDFVLKVSRTKED
jgi:hypothetical protein